uniref:Uncharacterized protein n=1 Tax=Anguilla anguilla TaxID=7936 RepID=A0A0E9QX46_ANGAN
MLAINAGRTIKLPFCCRLYCKESCGTGQLSLCCFYRAPKYSVKLRG